MLNIIKSAGTYFFGNAFIYAVPLLLLPILTNVLSPSDYGVVGTFNAIYQVVNIFVSMGAIGAVIRAYMDKDSINFSSYVFNAMLLNLVLFVTILIPIYFVYSLGILNLPKIAIYLLPLVVMLATLKAYKHKLWNIQMEAMKYSLFNAFFTLFSLLFSVLFVLTVFPDWRGRIYGIVIAETIFCIISLYYLNREEGLSFKINKNYIYNVFKYGAPLIPHSLGLMLISVSDKLLLNSFSGLSSVGIYTVAVAISSALMIIVIPIDSTINPYIFNIYKEKTRSGEKKYIVGFVLYFIIVSLAALVLYLIAPKLIQIFIGKEFNSAGNYIGILLIGQVAYAMYRYVARIIFFSKDTYLVSIATLSSGIIGFLCQYILIKRFGIIGAALGTTIAFILSFLLAWYFSNKVYPMQWRKTFYFLKELKTLFS